MTESKPTSTPHYDDEPFFLNHYFDKIIKFGALSAAIVAYLVVAPIEFIKKFTSKDL